MYYSQLRCKKCFSPIKKKSKGRTPQLCANCRTEIQKPFVEEARKKKPRRK